MTIFEDIGSTLGRGAGRVLGSFLPFRKGGMVPVAMANGGLAGIYANLPQAVREARGYVEQYLPQARQYLGLRAGGMATTPMGDKLMLVPMARKQRKRRVQKKKK